MKRRDNKLVKGGKYTKTAIMNQAWAYVRWYDYSSAHPAGDFDYNRGPHAGLFTGWGYNYTGA